MYMDKSWQMERVAVSGLSWWWCSVPQFFLKHSLSYLLPQPALHPCCPLFWEEQNFPVQLVLPLPSFQTHISPLFKSSHFFWHASAVENLSYPLALHLTVTSKVYGPWEHEWEKHPKINKKWSKNRVDRENFWRQLPCTTCMQITIDHQNKLP